MIMAFFSHCVQKKDKNALGGDDTTNGRLSYLLRNGYDEDILTIPDDVSEVRSKISYKTGFNYPQRSYSEKSFI